MSQLLFTNEFTDNPPPATHTLIAADANKQLWINELEITVLQMNSSGVAGVPTSCNIELQNNGGGIISLCTPMFASLGAGVTSVLGISSGKSHRVFTSPLQIAPGFGLQVATVGPSSCNFLTYIISASGFKVPYP